MQVLLIYALMSWIRLQSANSLPVMHFLVHACTTTQLCVECISRATITLPSFLPYLYTRTHFTMISFSFDGQNTLVQFWRRRHVAWSLQKEIRFNVRKFRNIPLIKIKTLQTLNFLKVVPCSHLARACSFFTSVFYSSYSCGLF